MDALVSVLVFNSLESSALVALLFKGTLLCLLGVSIGSESSTMPAIVRHRIAFGAVFSLAALPLLAMMLNSWELPILSREPESEDKPSSHLVSLLLWIYLIVVVISLGRLCLDVLRILLLSKRARTETTAKQLLPGLDHPRGDTPVKYSAEIRSPLTLGFLHPQVLLPNGASEWKADDLAMVLQHELAHVQRMDWAGHLLARCVHALYWPVPGIRVLQRQLSLSAEQACDDRVLATGVTASRYAAMLLRQAQGFRVPATVALGHSTELGTRIRGMVAEIVDHSPFAAGSVATFFTSFLLTLVVATAQLGQRPELPVMKWGSGEPDDSLETQTYPPPTLKVSPSVLAALESDTTRPEPPPAPARPPKFDSLEKPSVPPPQ